MILRSIVILLFLLTSGATLADSTRLFLTFDDGPVDASLNILDVLRANNVKATFFVNGNHLKGEGYEKESRAVEALYTMIRDGHVVANHGYDHMVHNHLKGSPANSVNAFQDIARDTSDFVPINVDTINEALGPLRSANNNAIKKIGRLPFSNNWRTDFVRMICPCCTTDDYPSWDTRTTCDKTIPISNSAKRAGDVLDRLYKEHGMKFYGWDVEWSTSDWDNPALSEHLLSVADLENEINRALNRSQCEIPTPYGACVHNSMKGKVIILTHDFFFENSVRGRGMDINIPKLDQFIKLAKSKGFEFATLDNYFP